MPFVDGGDDLGAQLQALARQIQQAKQFRQEEDRQKLTLALGSFQPGQHIGDLPGVAELYRRTMGRDIDPNYIPVPQTFEQMMSDDLSKRWATLKPDEQEAVRQSLLAGKATGQAGASTIKTVKSQQAVGEAKAGTEEKLIPVTTATTEATARAGQTTAETGEITAGVQKGLIQKGAESIAAAPDAQKALVGQMALTGGLLSEFQARENGAVLKASTERWATDMLNDPKGKGQELDKAIREITGGVGLAQAAAAGVLGLDNLLSQRGQLTLTSATGRQFADEFDAKLALALGGKFTPGVVKAFREYQEGGKVNPDIEKDPLYQTFRVAQEAGFQGYLNQQSKDSPLNKTYELYVDLLRNFPHDGPAIEAIGKTVQMAYGRTVANDRLGPRELSTDPESWDAFADAVGKTFGRIKGQTGALRFLPGSDIEGVSGPETPKPSLRIPMGGEIELPEGTSPESRRAVQDIMDAFSGFQRPQSGEGRQF